MDCFNRPSRPRGSLAVGASGQTAAIISAIPRRPRDEIHGGTQRNRQHCCPRARYARACQWISSPLGGYCRSDWLANSNSGGGAGHNCTAADNASEAGISSCQASFWSQSRRNSRRQQRARELREYRRKASTRRNPPCRPIRKRIRRETVPISPRNPQPPSRACAERNLLA